MLWIFGTRYVLSSSAVQRDNPSGGAEGEPDGRDIDGENERIEDFGRESKAENGLWLLEVGILWFCESDIVAFRFGVGVRSGRSVR